jgi:hypothetical protein
MHFIICEFFTYRSTLLSLLIGYLLFVIIGKLCSLQGFERIGKLITTRIYLLLIVLAGAYAGIYAAGKGELVEKYLPALWEISSLFSPEQEEITKPESTITNEEKPIIPASGEYIYEGTGEILSGSRAEQGILPL